MQEVDSAALTRVSKVLQLSTTGAELTEFQDELLQQVLDVAPMVRRGLTLDISGGIYTATILNTHVGSDTITTDVNPYVPATTFVGNGFPAEVSDAFDVWLLGLHAQNITAPGDFGGGFFGIITGTLGMAWRNEAGSIAMVQVIDLWKQETSGTGNLVVLTAEFAAPAATGFIKLPMRIRRSADVRFRFETVKSGVGAGTYKVFLTLGLFPAGLGQDVVAR